MGSPEAGVPSPLRRADKASPRSGAGDDGRPRADRSPHHRVDAENRRRGRSDRDEERRRSSERRRSWSPEEGRRRSRPSSSPSRDEGYRSRREDRGEDRRRDRYGDKYRRDGSSERRRYDGEDERRRRHDGEDRRSSSRRRSPSGERHRHRRRSPSPVIERAPVYEVERVRPPSAGLLHPPAGGIAPGGLAGSGFGAGGYGGGALPSAYGGAAYGVGVPGAPAINSLAGGILNQPRRAANPSLSLPHATRPQRRLYVGSLPAGCTDEQLRSFLNQALAAAGISVAPPGVLHFPVVNCQVTPERGFAFVEFAEMGDCTAALQLDGIPFLGSPLRVKRPKDSPPPFGSPPDPSPMGAVIFQSFLASQAAGDASAPVAAVPGLQPASYFAVDPSAVQPSGGAAFLPAAAPGGAAGFSAAPLNAPPPYMATSSNTVPIAPRRFGGASADADPPGFGAAAAPSQGDLPAFDRRPPALSSPPAPPLPSGPPPLPRDAPPPPPRDDWP